MKALKVFILSLAIFTFDVRADDTGANEAKPNATIECVSCQYYGFLSQGYVRSSANNFYGPSSRGSTLFHEIGIGGSVSPTPNLRLAGLILGRRAGEEDPGNLRIDYLLADLKFPEIGTNNDRGMLIGRIKPQIGLYNEVRAMASTRPSIILANAPYLEKARNYLAHGNGVRFYKKWQRESSSDDFNIDILNMYDAKTKYAEILYFGSETPGRLETKPFIGIHLQHEFRWYGTTKLAAYLATQKLHYRPGPGDSLREGDIAATYEWLSIQHSLDKLTLTGELFLGNFKYNNLGPYMFNKLSPGGGYLQASYAFNSTWEGFVRADRSYTNRDDRNGNYYSSFTHQPNFRAYQKDSVVGVRYYVNPTFQISTEYHRLEGTNMLLTADNPSAQQQKDWNLIAIQAAWQF